MTHEMLVMWDGSTLPLLSHSEIAALPADDRRRYEERLHGYDLDQEGATDHYARWVAYRDRCAAEGCTTKKYDTYRHCIKHISIDDIDDPIEQVNRRASKAKLRLAELLEKSVDELERMLASSPEDLAPAIRLKAIETVMDRAHLPRQTAQSVDMTGDVRVTHIDAADIINGRLDRLAASMATATVPGEITEG